MLAKSVLAALDEVQDISYKNKHAASSQLKSTAEKIYDEPSKFALATIGGALSLYFDQSDQKYHPMIELADGRRSYAVEDMNREAIEVLKEAIDVLSSVWMRAQLSDIIWLQTSDHSYAEIAVNEYISEFWNIFDENDWVECFEIIQRAYAISILLGKKSASFLRTKEAINSALEKMDGSDPLFLSIKLIKLSLDNATPKDRALYLSLAQKIHHRNIACTDENHIHITEASFELLCRLLKKCKRTVELQAVSIEMAEYYTICGKQLANGDHSRIQRAILLLKSACDLYNKGSNRHAALELRHIIAEYQRIALSNMASIPFEFDAKPIYDHISQLFDGSSLKEMIIQFGLLSIIYKKEDIKKQVLDNRHKFLSASLFTNKILNEEGHTIEIIPPLDRRDPEKAPDVLFKHMIKHVSDNRNLGEAISLQIAFNFLKSAGQVDLDDLSFLVDDNAIIPHGRNEIIKLGIHLGLCGNLYAAMHILLPQVEHLFRNLVSLCGDTVSFMKDDCEEYKPLSQLFKSEKLSECYDEDIIFTFQSIMDERTGANLRNLNAHGLLNERTGNGGTALCFLSLTIKILSLYSLEVNEIIKNLASKRKAIEGERK